MHRIADAHPDLASDLADRLARVLADPTLAVDLDGSQAFDHATDDEIWDAYAWAIERATEIAEVVSSLLGEPPRVDERKGFPLFCWPSADGDSLALCTTHPDREQPVVQMLLRWPVRDDVVHDGLEDT